MRDFSVRMQKLVERRVRTCAAVLVWSVAVVGCVSDTPYMPEDTRWYKSDTSEMERAFAMLDCQSGWAPAIDPMRGTVRLRNYQDRDTFRNCMEATGWQRVD